MRFKAQKFRGNRNLGNDQYHSDFSISSIISCLIYLPRINNKDDDDDDGDDGLGISSSSSKDS